MSDTPEAVPMLTALFDQLEAGHQAATNKPTRDELDTEFRAWFAEAADSRRPGFSINENVHARVD
ncbi:MAG: hypothetical protein M3Y90_08160 [Actinomycetota bacterium]|nr:hypothetical protein [Actinomycetota bacterium]